MENINRQIKFRVWFAQAKQMIYIGDKLNDTALWIEERGWDAVDHMMGKPESICSNYSNANPENVLMQFTGLHDDADVKIYDGDIVMDINGNKTTVEWNDDKHHWQFDDGSPFNEGKNYGTYKKVVGNIYQKN